LDQQQKEKIKQLEEQLTKSKADNEALTKTSEERKTAIEKMDTDVKDVAATIAKLEEARIVLNRLIGPGGSLTETERVKYFKNVVGAGAPEPR
jgi:predicted  nucleic acid-binding Zn-ribbon protein